MWWIIGGIAVLVLLVSFALCKPASKANKQIDDYLNNYASQYDRDVPYL